METTVKSFANTAEAIEAYLDDPTAFDENTEVKKLFSPLIALNRQRA